MGREVGQSNVGAVSNKGIEINLTYNGQIGRDFRFSISPNFTWVKNAVEKLANGATEEINNNRIVGQPIGIIYGYETGDWDSLMPRLMMMKEDAKLFENLRFAGGYAMRSSGYSSAYISGDLSGRQTVGDLKREGK